MNNQLIQYEAIRAAIVEATDVQHVLTLLDQAEAIRLLAQRDRDSLEIQNMIAESRLRCQRRAGELIPLQFPHGGNRASVSGEHLTLSDVGVTPKQAHMWQRIADVPENIFDDWIIQMQIANKPLTTNGAYAMSRRIIQPDNTNNNSDNSHQVQYCPRCGQQWNGE